jgi:cytochrome c oxidase subunit 2
VTAQLQIARTTGPWIDALRSVLALPPQASSVAPSIDALHFVVIGTTMLGAVGVAFVTGVYLIRYRRRAPDARTARMISGPAAILVKISVPLVLFVALWVIGFRQYVRLRTPPAGSMTVYVTAKQWMWKFAYPDGRSTIDELVVPIGRPVTLIMTSRDVLHSFYVPAFRIKQDVVPGRFLTVWFEATEPGRFEIFCAEFCGPSHSRMRGAVVALAPEEFARWRDRQKEIDGPSTEVPGVTDERASMVVYGARVARERQCLACHSIDGQRHVGPTWLGLYGATVPLEGNRAAFADAAYLTRSMMDPAADVHAGFPPVMPSYFGVLDASEAGALVAYIESLRDAPAGASGISLLTLPAPTAPPPASASASASAPLPARGAP